MKRPRPPGFADLARDLGRQTLVFLAGLFGYELVRGLVAAGGRVPYENARRVIGLERDLHLFVEPAIERFAQAHAEPVLDAAVWTYLNAHLLVTVGVLAYLYARHRDRFDRTRDTLLIAMAIALIGYSLYPTAPPRLLPAFGFTDPVQRATGVSTTHGLASVLVNPYAAIPSMHVCFALVLGRAMAGLATNRALKVAWLTYPLVIAATVVVTGNHLLADVLLGAVTALVASAAARPRVVSAHHTCPTPTPPLPATAPVAATAAPVRRGAGRPPRS